MPFSVILDGKPKKELAKLERALQARIVAKLELASNNPWHFLGGLRGRSELKLRVGDYRILADVNWAQKRIEVTKIGHRRNVYD
ncbi:MAG TPA: type II toxin-antitoxin system RelE/ParE family toxin [archaeon]|nr:type II toxin-antitoxin system RelE/ParE family toxin [archaeon]